MIIRRALMTALLLFSALFAIPPVFALTQDEVVQSIEKHYREVMDLTAFTMGMNHRLPLVVFNVTVPGNLVQALRGEAVGTRVVVEV